MAAAALLSGALHEAVGWQTMNYAVLPFLALVLAGLAWLGLSGRARAATTTAAE